MATDLKPGPEMDRAVAEAVGIRALSKALGDRVVLGKVGVVFAERMDGHWLLQCEPSGQVSHAIAALEATGQQCAIIWESGVRVVYISDSEFGVDLCRSAIGRGGTIPEAACRAILAWKEAQQDG